MDDGAAMHWEAGPSCCDRSSATYRVPREPSVSQTGSRSLTGHPGSLADTTSSTILQHTTKLTASECEDIVVLFGCLCDHQIQSDTTRQALVERGTDADPIQDLAGPSKHCHRHPLLITQVHCILLLNASMQTLARRCMSSCESFTIATNTADKYAF
jgi:hypothetical protein